MVCRYSLVGTAANPRTDYIAQTGLLKLGHQALQTTHTTVVAQHARRCLEQVRVVADQANQVRETAATALRVTCDRTEY